MLGTTGLTPKLLPLKWAIYYFRVQFKDKITNTNEQFPIIKPASFGTVKLFMRKF